MIWDAGYISQARIVNLGSTVTLATVIDMGLAFEDMGPILSLATIVNVEPTLPSGFLSIRYCHESFSVKVLGYTPAVDSFVLKL